MRTIQYEFVFSVFRNVGASNYNTELNYRYSLFGRTSIDREKGVVSLTIFDARLEDEGNYMVLVKSGAGNDSSAATVSVYQRPPRFLTPLEDVNVSLGKTATLHAAFEGMPKPDVLWFVAERGGAERQIDAEHSDKDALKFATHLDAAHRVASLSVFNVSPADADNVVYSCVLRSPIGTARSSADLRLQGTSYVYSKLYSTHKYIKPFGTNRRFIGSNFCANNL